MSKKLNILDQDVRIELNEMNHTELVELAHWVGMKNYSRAVPRELVISALQTLDPMNFPNPVDRMRDTLKSWMMRYWDRIAMQVPKSECPNCELCNDFQVVECHTENKHQFT